MKPISHTKDQQLFDSLRQSPTELSLGQVESFINRLPDLPDKPPVNNNWTHFFNLKTILMVFVPIAVIVSLMMWNQKDESNLSTSAITKTTQEVTPAVQTKEVLATAPTEPSASEPLMVAEEEVEEKQEEKPEEKENLPLPEKKKVKKKPLVKKEIVPSKEAPLTPEETLDEKHQEEKHPGTTIPQTIIEPESGPLPEMSGLALKKLKRQLYKNLLADEIIGFKGEEVEIQLPGGEVIINGQVLNSTLSQKYYILTSKAGVGSDRKIKMADAYIKVGDFTAEGFKGSGLGTFVEEMVEEEEEGGFFYESGERRGKDGKEELIRLEQKDRDLFAKKILDKSGAKKGRKKLFSIDISEDKTRKLFDELYDKLLSDQLIESPKSFVLFELPQDSIRLNGTLLKDELYQKYSELFSTYKIKQGLFYEVRLSEHTISIGEFNGSNFTGTTAVYED